MSAIEGTLKGTKSTVRWFLAVFALPILAVLFAAYQFYVEAPLLYSTKQETQVLDHRIIKMEEQIKQLPTGTQMKEIVKSAIKESREP